MRRWYGIPLIVAGLLVFLLGRRGWDRTEQVVDVGPLEVEATTRQRSPALQVAGGVLAGLGLGVLVLGSAAPRRD